MHFDTEKGNNKEKQVAACHGSMLIFLVLKVLNFVRNLLLGKFGVMNKFCVRFSVDGRKCEHFGSKILTLL